MLALGLVRGRSFVIEGYGDVFVLKVMSKIGKVLVRYRIGDVDEYRLLDLDGDYAVGTVGSFRVPKLEGNLATFGLNIDRAVGIYRDDRGLELDDELSRLALLSPEMYLEYLTYCAFYGNGLSKRERKFYGSEVRRVKRELGLLDDADVLVRSVTWETIVDREREIALDNEEIEDELENSDWVEGIHYRLEERTRLDVLRDEWVTDVIEVPIERVVVTDGDDLVEEVSVVLVDEEDFGSLLEATWSNNNIYEKELEEELMRLEDYELDMELYGEEVRGHSRKKASKGKKKKRDVEVFEDDFRFDGRKRNKMSKGKGMNGGTKRTHKVVNLVDDRYDGEDD